MQSTARILDQVKGVVWLLFGVYLLLAFFLPNYTTPIIDFDGLDLLRTAIRDSKALKRLVQDLPTFFMVITPFAYWFVGFLAVLVGILTLSGRNSSLGLFVTILSGITLLTSLLTIYLLLNRNDTPSFFAKMLPRPSSWFYLAVLAQVLVLGTGILSLVTKKNQAT
jgi:hypothetical protein